MFYDEKDPMIENLSIMFCHSDVIWSCIYEDALDNDSIIDDIIGEVTDNECYGAYSNGRVKDEKSTLSFMAFNGEPINSSVKEKAVKFFSEKFKTLLKAIYTQLKEIITKQDLACDHNNRHEELSLFFYNEETTKSYDDKKSGISWSMQLHCDASERSYIPIRLLKDGTVSYVNFAFVNKKYFKEKDSELKSKILSDFLTLVTEDVELLDGSFNFHHKYGYIKTIAIEIDLEDLSKSSVVDAGTVESRQMHSMILSRQKELIDDFLDKIREQYLDEYDVGYLF